MEIPNYSTFENIAKDFHNKTGLFIDPFVIAKLSFATLEATNELKRISIELGKVIYSMRSPKSKYKKYFHKPINY